MSASEAPSPGDIANEFPISPDEAQVIADAMSPLQDLAGAGGAIGSAMEGIPGPGPKLVGIVLQNLATHADLASVSVETLAHAMTFYVESQTKGLEMLFPPPHVAAEQFGNDIQPLAKALERQRGELP